MYKIEVEEVLDMPIDAAFQMLTDHSNYNLYPGIKAAQLLKSGKDEPNGVGAVREVKLNGATLQEEIVRFEKNKVMEYRIRDAKPLGIYHPMGRMEFSEAGDKTKVYWTSEFGMKLPLFGQLLDNYLGPKMAKAFSNLLQGVASRYRFFSR